MAFFHPASHDETYELRIFESSGDAIDHRLGDRQDIACNWANIGVEDNGDGQRRAVLVERSSLAVAYVVGDGEHFGEVVSPTAEEVGAIAARFRDRPAGGA